MGKKRKHKRIVPREQCTPEEFAARLARTGSAGLELLTQYEDRVRLDPELWAEPFGATQAQMLESIAVLRGLLIAETLNSSLAAVGV